jgi:hypothetical protein
MSIIKSRIKSFQFNSGIISGKLPIYFGISLVPCLLPCTITWEPIKGKEDIAISEFTYKANGWSKPRILKAMRSVKEYVQVEYLGERYIVLVYQYACYISSYDIDAI